MEPLLQAKQKAERELNAILEIDRKTSGGRKSAALISSNGMYLTHEKDFRR